jgi:hypothetical protein
VSRPVEPFTNLFRSAALAFADARAVLEDESAGAKPDADALSYSNNALLTGLEKLALLVRRFSASPEYRNVMRGERLDDRPIISDPSFRVAAETTAAEIDANKNRLGIGGTRIAGTLRRWLESRSPEQAQLLDSQCATTARMLKRKAR